jgi:ABC-type methionine transport system ATPase subunit
LIYTKYSPSIYLHDSKFINKDKTINLVYRKPNFKQENNIFENIKVNLENNYNPTNNTQTEQRKLYPHLLKSPFNKNKTETLPVIPNCENWLNNQIKNTPV